MLRVPVHRIQPGMIDFNLDARVRPKVQRLYTPDGQRVEHPSLEEIDLRLHDDLETAAVDGQDVRPFTTGQTSAEPEEALV